MNKFKAALTLPCILLSGHVSADIIISKVVEGSGYNKAIEIANIGNQTVSLAGYMLQKETNFNGDWQSDYLLGDITLAPFQTYVIGHANSSVDEQLKAKFDVTNSTITNFNGDDPLRLLLNDEVVDMFGPNVGSGDFNKDITLVRCNYMASPVWDLSDWITLPKDSWETLGTISQTCDASTPPEVPDGITTTIMNLQGEGMWSPYTDPSNGQYESEEIFEVTGVVTHIQSSNLDNDLLTGFFIQDQHGDNNAATSDGIFVNGSPLGLAIGDEVVVTGKVLEHYSWTQINAARVEKTGTQGIVLPATTIVPIASDQSFEQTLERYEGMLVRVNNATDMHVARTFGFDYSAYRNNMVLSHQSVNYHPNQFNTPLSQGAQQVDASNADRRLFVESPSKAANGVIPWYPDFAQDNGTGTTDDYIRVGAELNEQGLTGLLGYSYSEYRLYVISEANSATFVENTRPTTPTLKAGELVVSSFNVENFFTSPFGGRNNPLNQNRGAESLDDYNTQLNKIVSALIAINADIYGLIEIENNGFDEQSAIYTLVEEINRHLESEDQYQIAMPAQIEGEGYVGTDAITNKIIYRPSVVELNDIHIIEMPQQHVALDSGSYKSAYQRDAFTASFKIENADEQLVISTNHFKSKGSTCWEDEQSDHQQNDVNMQGSCENFRVSAAYHLANELEKIDGYKVLMGDLNSYGLEDPMLVLTEREQAPQDYQIWAARNTYIGGNQDTGTLLHGDEGAIIEQSFGYLDIVEAMKPHTYSYSFNDTVGTLDYVLVDTDLTQYVVDAQVWPINAVESTLFEYSTQYSGELTKYTDPYRSSDHDPAIVVFKFNSNDIDDENVDGNEPENDHGNEGENESQDGQESESAGGSLDLILLMLILSGFSMRHLRRNNK
ncbi:ExeM/NucH family extracellular endonuclease [Vibrio gallicus]|uniref:ExeM/NucH family extracellular endonuclease n=1 Tax=Vibrio gallicus TaxID=190897 RepID=UPI0021C2E01D|nr:ExeM/NucH family extracellular endonuclease [Vibrio gallicus]